MAKKNSSNGKNARGAAPIISDDQFLRLVVTIDAANRIQSRPHGYELIKELGELAENRPDAFDDLAGKGRGEDARLLDQVQMALQARPEA